MLRRGSTCALKIDVDGIQLASKAARFRLTSRSAHLSSGMEHGSFNDLCFPAGYWNGQSPILGKPSGS